VLALSRGALMMFAFACGLVILGSLARRFTRKKVYVTIALAVAFFLVLAKSMDSIIERFVTAPDASVEARDRFEDAAQAMLDDSFLGIGINQYSHVLEHGGYADRFEMPDVDRDGLAHHIYWLTAAELGWLGLFAYLWLIAAPFYTAVRGAFRLRHDVRGDVLLGCAAGMAAMHVHGVAEWIARQPSMMYLFWIVAGMAAAMSRRAERKLTGPRPG
jgi:O-antigen ligase